MSKKAVLSKVPTYQRPVDAILGELTESAAAQDPEGRKGIRNKQTTLLLSEEVMRDLNDLACYYQAIGKTYTVTRADGTAMERKMTVNKIASDAIAEYIGQHQDEIEKYRKRDF